MVKFCSLLLLGLLAVAPTLHAQEKSPKVYKSLKEAATADSEVHYLNLATSGRKTISDTFRLFQDLRHLDLSFNEWTDLPLASMPQAPLDYLNLCNNKVAKLPNLSRTYPGLRQLKLSFNPLEVLPSWLGRFSRLEHLDVGHCQLKSLPDELTQLKELKFLNLAGNEFDKLPPCLKGLEKLDSLCLRDNPLDFQDLIYGLPLRVRYLDIRPMQLNPGQYEMLQRHYPFLSYINTHGSHDLPNTLGEWPVPSQYVRVSTQGHPFGSYLRQLKLKDKSKALMLYSGDKKPIQTLHEAVIPLSMSKNDLQQCADVAMRLWADFHFKQEQLRPISFQLTNGFPVPFSHWAKGDRVGVRGNRTWWRRKAAQPDTSYANLLAYLQFVYRFAGSYSLSKQLDTVESKDAQIGDLFVHGGFPGHVALIGDMAVNPQTGEQVFLLIQGNTPAQELELVRNLNNPLLSPWFRFPPGNQKLYPRRRFDEFVLMRFAK